MSMSMSMLREQCHLCLITANVRLLGLLGCTELIRMRTLKEKKGGVVALGWMACKHFQLCIWKDICACLERNSLSQIGCSGIGGRVSCEELSQSPLSTIILIPKVLSSQLEYLTSIEELSYISLFDLWPCRFLPHCDIDSKNKQ